MELFFRVSCDVVEGCLNELYVRAAWTVRLNKLENDLEIPLIDRTRRTSWFALWSRMKLNWDAANSDERAC